jgi:hypothetical protein
VKEAKFIHLRTIKDVLKAMGLKLEDLKGWV